MNLMVCSVYCNVLLQVKCTLSGHEMPAKKDALQSYISGKKYQRLHKMKECDLEKYKRHLVPSSKKWRK